MNYELVPESTQKLRRFQGAVQRKEYWMFVIFHILFLIVAMLLDNLLGTAAKGDGFGFIFFGYALVTFLPGLAVSVRRLHSVEKSGWYMIVGLVPLFGTIWLWGLMSIGGKPGYNRYGQNAKVAEAGFA